MNYKEANKALRRVGAAHAAGDSLRAMYADLLAGIHGGNGGCMTPFLIPALLICLAVLVSFHARKV